MSLDLNKLEKVVELADGAKRARCPACAESGQDRKGEHLRIYPDGRFGCCVHAGDREHRQRIFALAGRRERQSIRVKVAAPKSAAVLQSGVLGRLGRVFGGPTRAAANITTEVGTLGTGQYIYTHEKKSPEKDNNIEKLKEFGICVPSVPMGEVRPVFETPVPSVPTVKEVLPESQTGVPSVPTCLRTATNEKLPFLTADGTLVIPFDSPERFHWWKGGQSIAETRKELEEGQDAAAV